MAQAGTFPPGPGLRQPCGFPSWLLCFTTSPADWRLPLKKKLDLNALDAADARYVDQFRRTAREHLQSYVEAVMQAAPRFGNNAYVCPSCKNSTGSNQLIPAFFLFRNREGGLRFKCNVCGITGDIFDLAGIINDTDSFIEQQIIVAGFLGINLDERTPLDYLQSPAPQQQSSKTKLTQLKQEAASYIRECQHHVGQTDYFRNRGLSQETIERFRLGYDPMRNRAVVPFSPAYYMARNAAVRPDVHSDHKYYKPEGLAHPLFNFGAITKKHEPVFLTESPIDAMSIIQCGGNAAALGSNSTSVFRRIFAMYMPDTFFILTFDNDGPGRRLTESISKILTAQGLPYSIPLHPAFTDYKDANAALMADPGLLACGVAEERNRALDLWEKERSDMSVFKTAKQMRKRS